MLKKKKSKSPPEISSGSMADIAFLLLIFFLVSTKIDADKGVTVRLPPKRDVEVEIDVHERDVFNILINSRNMMLVEEQPMGLKDLGPAIKRHVLNNGIDPHMSVSPEKAVVSIKNDRGTDYDVYIMVMDEVKKAYNEMRADVMGIPLESYLKTISDEKLRVAKKDDIARARKTIPYQVSEANPTAVGG